SGNEEDLPGLVAAAAAAIRAKLDLPHLSGPEQRFTRAVLPSNSEALRLYAAGLEDLYTWKYETASGLFAKAIAGDSAYALAYAGLARALSEQGDTQPAISRIREALNLSYDLPREQRLLVEAEYYEIESEWSKARDIYAALFKLYPDHLDYGLAAAGLESGSGALEAIAALRRLPAPMRADPRIDILKATAEFGLRNYSAARLAAEAAAIKARERSAQTVLARSLLLQAGAERMLGQMKRADALYTKAERIGADLGDRATQTEGMRGRAAIAVDSGELKTAASLYAQALEIGRAAKSPRIAASSSAGLGRVRLEQGNLSQAERLLNRSLALLRRQQSYTAIPPEETGLAELFLRQGELRKAYQFISDALKALANTRGRSEVEALAVLARIRVEQGQISAASQAVNQALQISDELSDKYSPARILLTAGYVAREEGSLGEARKQYGKALHSFSALHLSAGAAEARLGLAQVALDEGKGSSAASLARQARADLEKEGRTGETAAARAIEAGGDLLRNRVSAAEAVLRPALRQRIQDRLVADLVGTTAARLEAKTGHTAKAVARLHAILARAARLGLVRDRLEAELALAAIEPQFNSQRIAAEAGRDGFGGIASRAGKLSRR
ncbi:MAG: tetratricopeptide repeat protein, partial [Bryobacteraceae bacterium]